MCYLFGFNRGSEWLLGENAFHELEEGGLIITAKHQLIANGYDGKINGIPYLRKNNRISVVGIFGGLREPNSPMKFRIDYFIWVVSIYRLLRRRLGRSIIRHINFAQILSPIPKKFLSSKYFHFGPVGGQGEFYSVKYLPIKSRIVNFIVCNILYKMVKQRISSANVSFVHPTLAKQFAPNSVVEPAIKLKYRNYVNRAKSPRIVHISNRGHAVKLPKLHYELFYSLAKTHPDKQFLIAGKGWRECQPLPNLICLDMLPRDDVIKLFSTSEFHVNLSLELAGIVNLEAALNRCITIGASKSGAEYLLNLDNMHIVDVYSPDTSVDLLAEKISNAIENYDKIDANKQMIAASRFVFNS